ncbi:MULTISPECIES: phospholipase effector Tle1 domain-containing protein [unclassified Paraburkholderia]|uniref:phospholipase effector Tle1 domain-containing protein n=1 Tax=unclassified Paraburkholderia TaxID=2615204 RepID=UPI002AB042D9|nr:MULTISPECIES: DUF2235 domain-containing protein [unclassified Paraburkholderia]
MAEINLKKDAASAEIYRTKAEAEQICPACEHVLWASFFFDGFGFSDRYGPRTNISKLFDALNDDSGKNMRKFYYPGLGADYDPEDSPLKAVLLDRATDTLEDKAKEKRDALTTDKLKDALKEEWSKSGKVKDASLGGRVSSTIDGVYDRLKGGASKAAKEIERTTTKPASQGRRAMRYVRKEWKQFYRDALRYPYRLPKQLAKELGKETAGAFAESFQLLRDTKLGAALFNTGVDTRLKSAEAQFKAAVAAAKKTSTLNSIHVALFGYDMGGGLALAFANQLLEEVCKGGKYDGVSVKIKFVGLFDCVTNRFDDNLLTGYIPMSNEVSSDLIVSPEIEKCVHYAAAHELRFYKPLTMLGVDPADMRGPRQERLFPGAQVDVGGGAVEGEEGLSDKLARVPLEMMYYRAYGAGIPMPKLEDLAAIDIDLQEEILAPREIEDFQLTYRQTVKKLVAVTREIPNLSSLGPDGPMGLPSAAKPATGALDFLNPKTPAPNMLDGCHPSDTAAPPRPVVITDLPKSIQGELKGHMVVYIQWLRMWYDQPQNRAAAEQRNSGVFGGVTNPLAHGRYEKLTREIAYLKQHGTKTLPSFDQAQAMKQIDGKVPASMFNTDPEAQALFWLWNTPGERQPAVETMYPMFAKHVHDSMAESEIEDAWSRFVAIKNYMNTRWMQKIGSEPDKSYLERVTDFYKSLLFPEKPESPAK